MPPGPLVALAAVAGVTAGAGWPVPLPDALALATAAASLAVACASPAWRRAWILLAIGAVATLHGAAARERALGAPLGAWLDARAPGGRAGAPVGVRGRLAADATATAFGVRLSIDVDEVQEAGGWRRAPGRVQAHVAGTLAGPAVAGEWRQGRAVRAPLALRRPHLLRNPGEARPLWQRLRQPFDLVGSIKSAALVDVERGAWWTELAAGARARVRAAVARHVAPRDPQAAAVVTALLIGDRAGLDDRLERRLQAAGTYHTIAISGGNVAILTALCFVLSRLIFRSARAAIIVAIAVVAMYGAIVGPQPSVTRAVIAAVVYLMLTARGLTPRPLHALATVALVVAVADPLSVLDVGAWLSFGATLGILLGATRLAAWLGARIVGARTAAESGARRIARWAVMLLAATVAAEVALLPVAASSFSRVGVAGLVLNFIAIPAMTVAQIAGMALVLCAGWWNGAAHVGAAIAQGAASLLLDSAVVVDVLPWTTWRVPPMAVGWSIAFYALLTATLLARTSALRRWPRRAAEAGAVVCGLAIATAPGVELNQPGSRLRVTMLDVGQGDAILLQFPTGHALLVDAGGSSSAFDIGGRIVTPALWALGVRRLDWLAVTHPDLDHIGGALSVLRDFEPREVWEGVSVPPNAERAALRQAADDAGIAWRTLRAGDAIEIGAATLRVEHPPPPDWERQRTRNEDSVVMRVTLGDVELWLTGDAGAEFERRIDALPDRRPLRVLKVGHHGSRSSTSVAWLAALRPHVALISAGRANLFGHPAPDVLSRLDRHRIVVLRTDRDGAVQLETDGRSITVTTMTGRRWTLRTFEQ